jgi:predicted nucleic acid-binding Zn ribbon protein
MECKHCGNWIHHCMVCKKPMPPKQYERPLLLTEHSNQRICSEACARKHWREYAENQVKNMVTAAKNRFNSD